MRIAHSNDSTPFVQVARNGAWVPQKLGDLNLTDVKVGDVIVHGKRGYTLTQEDLDNKVILLSDGKVWRDYRDGHPVFLGSRTYHRPGTAETYSVSEFDGNQPYNHVSMIDVVDTIQCVRDNLIDSARWHWNAAGNPGTLEDFAMTDFRWR
jgi:hypothetical protein